LHIAKQSLFGLFQGRDGVATSL